MLYISHTRKWVPMLWMTTVCSLRPSLEVVTQQLQQLVVVSSLHWHLASISFPIIIFFYTIWYGTHKSTNFVSRGREVKGVLRCLRKWTMLYLLFLYRSYHQLTILLLVHINRFYVTEGFQDLGNISEYTRIKSNVLSEDVQSAMKFQFLLYTTTVLYIRQCYALHQLPLMMTSSVRRRKSSPILRSFSSAAAFLISFFWCSLLACSVTFWSEFNFAKALRIGILWMWYDNFTHICSLVQLTRHLPVGKIVHWNLCPLEEERASPGLEYDKYSLDFQLPRNQHALLHQRMASLQRHHLKNVSNGKLYLPSVNNVCDSPPITLTFPDLSL